MISDIKIVTKTFQIYIYRRVFIDYMRNGIENGQMYYVPP